MATARQLKALLRSFSEDDTRQFYATAMQVAAHEARLGHAKLAEQLRELIDEAKRNRGKRTRAEAPVPIRRPRGDLAGLLSVAFPSDRLGDLVLPDRVRERLERIVFEQRQKDRILAHDLLPRSKVLLVGPPGSGKTYTAKALAGELGLPLYTIQLDGLITKFMGETAGKLRTIFQAIENDRGVYLFDEFDAIGGQRNLGNDVGEIRRILNSFLQFVDEADPESVIVAASNHPQLLDAALFRRFDDVIEYALPSEEEAERLLRWRLDGLKLRKIDWEAVVEAAHALSYAEIVKACNDIAKTVLLSDMKHMETPTIVQALEERRAVRRTTKQ